MFYVPKCRLAHGVSSFAQKSGETATAKGSYSFSIDINDDLSYFPDTWKAIEEEIKTLIVKDSKALLGKSYDADDIKGMWTPKIKRGGIKDEKTNERYNSAFAIKQQFDWETGVSKTQYLDGQNKNSPLSITYLNASTEIPRGSICMMYLRLYKISFVNGKFHVALYPTQVSINRPTARQMFAPLPIASDETMGITRDDDDESIDTGKEPAEDFKVNDDDVENDSADDIPDDSIKQVATPRKVTKKATTSTTKEVKPKGRARAST